MQANNANNLARTGDPNEAERWYQQALQINPCHRMTLYNYGLLLLNARNDLPRSPRRLTGSDRPSPAVNGRDQA
jgi:Tfp pilus assembly protein PilF